ncbi:MAG: hypothetical protein ACP5NV_01915 [Candidatus Woesearchaeota archaeon]
MLNTSETISKEELSKIINDKSLDKYPDGFRHYSYQNGLVRYGYTGFSIAYISKKAEEINTTTDFRKFIEKYKIVESPSLNGTLITFPLIALRKDKIIVPDHAAYAYVLRESKNSFLVEIYRDKLRDILIHSQDAGNGFAPVWHLKKDMLLTESQLKDIATIENLGYESFTLDDLLKKDKLRELYKYGKWLFDINSLSFDTFKNGRKLVNEVPPLDSKAKYAIEKIIAYYRNIIEN